MSENTRHIVISATFTADYVGNVLEFWSSRFNQSVQPLIAPYAQVYQQLFQAGSKLRRNRDGANILLIRWKDLAVALPQAYARAVRELKDAVLSFEHQAPLLIVLCPEHGETAAVAEANAMFKESVSGVSSIAVVDATEYLSLYGVSQIHDTLTERTGQIPYTAEAMTAIGTSIFRWWDMYHRKPLKMLAVDCDNTLWRGVVGEDGTDGIHISDGHRYLQQNLINQSVNGRLVSLFSKNEQHDVDGVFEQRQDLVLQEEHLISSQINWQSKPQNMIDVVDELGIGLDSVVFLDDSMVECAEMRAICPDVMTIQVPKSSGQLQSFVDHLWVLDQSDVTEEDRSRVQMYKEQAIREATKRGSGSLADFFDSLELEVDISKPSTVEAERFAQLTQRTNQFNASIKRLGSHEILQDLNDPKTTLRIVSAKDRFGDYGIVGAMRAEQHGSKFIADVFLLSCRAMGRGIEHQMIAELGEIALRAGLDSVSIQYTEGARNQPAKQFLQNLNLSTLSNADENYYFLSIEEACSLKFDPTANTAQRAPVSAPLNGEHGTRLIEASDSGNRYQKIAHELTTASDIILAMRGQILDRPDLPTDYIAPSSDLEKSITQVWEEVLRIHPVGIYDGFYDLGGKSIQLVQIHSLMQQQLSTDIEFTSLFEHRTIASLVKSLGQIRQEHSAYSVSARAQKMRRARDRRATMNRHKQEILS